jgi:MFS family permease
VLRATSTTTEGRLFRLLIGALILVSAAAQFALVPVMPVYARRLGLSGFEQGMVLGATGLATLVVSVPAGALSDRFGARRITLAAGLLMAAATAAQALAGSFPVLLAARLAFGAGYGMVWTAGLCWLAGAMAGGPPALGGSVASAGIGGVAGPAVSGALAQSLGLAVPLLATAAGFAVITAGLAVLRVPPGPAAPYRASTRGERPASKHRDLIGAAAAVVTAGLSTGVCALLVPARLQAAGASSGQIGLAFAAAGILFAVGSALTAALGRRAVNLTVACGGMLVVAGALSLAVVGSTPLLLVAMLCVTTAARSVLWTVSYPLAASAGAGSSASSSASSSAGGGAGRGAGTGLGASVGLLNVIWAATAVLGPLGAGAAAGHLGVPAAFGLTQAVCAAALAVTAVLAWRARRPSARIRRPGQVGHGLQAEVEHGLRLPGRAEP